MKATSVRQVWTPVSVACHSQARQDLPSLGPNLHGQRVCQYFFLILSTSTWGQRRKTPAMCQETMAYLRVKQEGLGIPLHTQLSPSSSLVSHLLSPFQRVETRAMSRPGLGQPHWEERISFYWLVCEVKPRVSTASPRRKGFWALHVSLTVPTPDTGYLSSYH